MREGHLQVPECVQIATEEYHRKFDKIGAFIEDCVIKVPGERVGKGELYRKYTAWCSDDSNRYKPVNAMTFHTDMERRGFYTRKYNGNPMYKDMKVVNAGQKNNGKIQLTPMKGESTDEG